MRTPTLIVHGGAWAIPPEMAEDHQRGVTNALATGYAILERGGTATDAVEAAITVLEDDPTFDAGRGSFLTSEGRVQLDALLMDGATLRAGGVACVEHLRNPIQAARLVLDKSPHIYFVGPGAEAFAASHGMPLIHNSELVLDRERHRLAEAQSRLAEGLADITFSGPLATDDKSPETAASRLPDPNESGCPIEEIDLDPSSGSRVGGTESPSSTNPADPCSLIPDPSSHDTVGAVALDSPRQPRRRHLHRRHPQQSPRPRRRQLPHRLRMLRRQPLRRRLPHRLGEPIMKLVLGKWATDRVAQGTSPELAAQQAIAYLFQRLGGHGGIILLGPDGQFGLAHNTPGMAWGIANHQGQRTGLAI